MKESLIKYGISMNYISDWGFTEAYREILQNFKDYGEYVIDDRDPSVTVTNDYSPKSLEFLKVGFSDKNGNPNACGKHGEGIKMALLVLHRLKIACAITFEKPDDDDNTLVTIEPTTYIDDALGECFGLKVSELSHCVIDCHYLFTCSFDKTEEYKSIGKDFLITEDDIIFSHSTGRIVNKPIGNVYVGGIYVTNVSGLSHSYDFNPCDIQLGRDRQIPCTTDIELYGSRIHDNYLMQKENITVDDVNFENRDFTYCRKLPDAIVKEIEPFLDSDNEITFSCHNKVIPYSIRDALLTSPIMREKIQQIRVGIVEIQKPYDQLTEWYRKHKWRLNTNAQYEFEAIKASAISWEKV